MSIDTCAPIDTAKRLVYSLSSLRLQFACAQIGQRLVYSLSNLPIAFACRKGPSTHVRVPKNAIANTAGTHRICQLLIHVCALKMKVSSPVWVASTFEDFDEYQVRSGLHRHSKTLTRLRYHLGEGRNVVNDHIHQS